MNEACIDPRLVDAAEKVVRLMRERHKTIATAESCTAGLVAAVLANVDGAGDVLHGGFVSYSKPGKSMMLGVSADLLDRTGSVNEEVAAAMTGGALDRSPADVALSVTGVLGPEPDEDGNPVGRIFLGCAVRGGTVRIVRLELGKRPHDALRHETVIAALDLVADTL